MAWNAVDCTPPGSLVCCAMDARRSQIYNALFRIENGAPRRLCPDRAIGLDALARELGIADSVVFAGRVSDRKKLMALYRRADLFVFPSIYDNAPLVVREAAALHTPAVMARGATAATILKDGENGFLVDNDPDCMAQLLRELIHDPERVHRVGVQASRTIVRSWEDCVEEVLDRYNALLRRRGLPLIERPA